MFSLWQHSPLLDSMEACTNRAAAKGPSPAPLPTTVAQHRKWIVLFHRVSFGSLAWCSCLLSHLLGLSLRPIQRFGPSPIQPSLLSALGVNLWFTELSVWGGKPLYLNTSQSLDLIYFQFYAFFFFHYLDRFRACLNLISTRRHHHPDSQAGENTGEYNCFARRQQYDVCPILSLLSVKGFCQPSRRGRSRGGGSQMTMHSCSAFLSDNYRSLVYQGRLSHTALGSGQRQGITLSLSL